MTITSPISTASSVNVATVNTTPKRPSIARVIAWASLATKTAALDASLSRLHSIPAIQSNHQFSLVLGKLKIKEMQRVACLFLFQIDNPQP